VIKAPVACFEKGKRHTSASNETGIMAGDEKTTPIAENRRKRGYLTDVLPFQQNPQGKIRYQRSLWAIPKKSPNQLLRSLSEKAIVIPKKKLFVKRGTCLDDMRG